MSLQLVAGVVGFCAYLPLIVGILKNTAKQSFAAFFLWALLDAIATVTTFLQHGNYWLPFSNVVGSCIITALLVVKKQVSWSWIESMTAILVVICLGVWYTAGEEAGIIASTLAVVTASVPQMAETFKAPQNTPVIAYVIFLTANILSFIAGRSWTIEERFYPGCSILLCTVIVVLASRKGNSLT
jgi:hypothetical protein